MAVEMTRLVFSLLLCLLWNAFTAQASWSFQLTDVTCYDPTSKAPSGITCNCTGGAVNCSYRGLTSVPRESFDASITSLDLHANVISDLPDSSFVRYVNLRVLDLSQNSISSLNDHSFGGLRSLTTLNLNSNMLQMFNENFPPNVFRPLITLETLLLNNNSLNVSDPAMNYPDQALSVLTNLKTLYLDGLQNKVLGPGFLNLTSLTNLILSGYYGLCQIKSLTSETFENVPYLHFLDISNCSLQEKNVSHEAFVVFTNLVTLNISDNEDLGIEAVGEIMRGLKEKATLRELSMRLVVNQYSMGICLSTSLVKFFPKHLQILDAQENNFIAYSSRIIETFLDLTYLDLSGNRFIFGKYLKSLKDLTNLKHLILSGSNFVYNLPSDFPQSQKLTLDSANLCDVTGNDLYDTSPFSFPLPPNLEKLEVNKADLQYRLTQFTVGANKLKTLSLANNTFPSLVGPIHGLDELEVLDLSFNYIEFISDEFFDTLSTLKKLNISNNLLGSFLSVLVSPRIFSSLRNLTVLDLSENFIIDFTCDLFSNLTSLEYFNISKNALIRFEVDISRMSNLIFLDFHLTRMTGLTSEFRDSIDRLLSNERNVSIDMSNAPISCNCKNYDFMTWMTSSKAFSQGFKNYICVYPDQTGHVVNDDFEEDMNLLNHQCASNVLLFSMIAIAMIVVVGAVVGGIVYKYRWKLRYLYNAAYLQFKSSRRGEDDEFDYDAFISYDQEDGVFVTQTLVPELEKREIHLCIHASEFTAGEYISSNIVKAVNRSRKTVVVLTQNMLSSYWCNFEIQMANMEALHTGRRVLVFLLVDNIPTKDLGLELLYYIRSNTYIPFPKDFRDTNGMSWLWDKVANDIRND
uniref:TIR domain-containing protein n=1 Tax=Biomphalaria glabrata TaxID=6526 RepID=A0A2C9MAP5_BIOGL